MDCRIKGAHFLCTLFIAIGCKGVCSTYTLWKLRKIITDVLEFKHLTNILCDKPDFLLVIDDDAKVCPERAIVDFLYVIHTFVTLSL